VIYQLIRFEKRLSKSFTYLWHFFLESVRIGWNRQSLDPTRSYPGRMQIRSRDNAKDELSDTPVSPLFLPIAIPVSLYFPCYASKNAHALTRQKADTMGT